VPNPLSDSIITIPLPTAASLEHPTRFYGFGIATSASLFATERSNQPKVWSGRLGDLLGVRPIERVSKKGSPCFSMVRYAPGKTRNNDNVEAVTGIVLDFDHVTPGDLCHAYHQVQGRFAGALYTTFSDLAGGSNDRCARLVLPATREMLKSEAKVVRREVARAIGIKTDDTTVDPARLWYLPSAPVRAANGRYLGYLIGKILDPDTILASAKPEAATAAAVAPEKDWRSIAANGATPGGRHGALLSFAAHLLGKGVDPVVALDLLRAWNTAKNVPPKPDAEVVAIVNYIAGRELKKLEVRHGR
jgi:hypothetical protein